MTSPEELRARTEEYIKAGGSTAAVLSSVLFGLAGIICERLDHQTELLQKLVEQKEGGPE